MVYCLLNSEFAMYKFQSFNRFALFSFIHVLIHCYILVQGLLAIEEY